VSVRGERSEPGAGWWARLVPPSELLRLRLCAYPPYVGAGIVVTHIAPDVSAVEVELRARPWNRNYVGTHFGGSLYSMADPFFMLIVLRGLGPGWIVWDKSAAIRFRKPGRGTVRARFHVPPERLEAIRARFEPGVRSVDERFTVEILDAEGDVVAEVEKVVYVRRKSAESQPP
jgi:acyl-coenzyme A thioesterase PaaI-like protein